MRNDARVQPATWEHLTLDNKLGLNFFELWSAGRDMLD
jgi:hypothetical protein